MSGITPTSSLPPCKLIVRGKQNTQIYNVTKSSASASEGINTSPLTLTSTSTLVDGAASPFYVRSSDGAKVAVMKPGSGIEIHFMKGAVNCDAEIISCQDSANVQTACFSPLGNYLLTWERNNGIKIWCTAGKSNTGGKCLKQLNLKMIRKESWPNVQWTHDEKYMFHIVTNEIHVYDLGKDPDIGVPTYRFRIETIVSFQLAPSTSEPGMYHFTSFCPEKKGKPAKISGHAFNPLNLQGTENTFSTICSKSVFQAEECTIKWSPTGHAALAVTQTSVDTSGDSYYGSTGLYLLHMLKCKEQVINVPLAKSGVVLDTAWSPDETKPCFVVISGRMPAQACLHHGSSADPLFLFGEAHRNTISWSKHGRFLCLAGLGNLAGGMDFWDKNKLKKMNSQPITAVKTVVGFDWSPDSRMFVVSTTAPRMNVDNGLAVYKYNGDGPLATMDIGTLYEVNWIPSNKSDYPDRPATPVKKKKNKNGEQSSSPDNGAVAAAPAPVGRYVPPSARGRTGGMSLADRMRAEKDAKMASSGAPRKITRSEGAKMRGTNAPVGMALTPAKEKELKAKKAAEKKEKARLKKEAEAAALKKAQEEEEARLLKAQQELEAANRNDPVKRTKKINKILKQIKMLKEKDPSTLNDDQKQKLAQEDALLAELETLKI